jgi:steroid delta-isomerase-like uncharacterized protein
MRRNTQLLAIGIVMVLGVAIIPWAGRVAHAQAATPAASPVALSPLVQQWVDGVNAGDGAAVAALYREDGVHEDVPSGLIAQDRDQIAQLVLVTGPFRDVHWDVVRAHQTADFATLEYTVSATARERGQPLLFRGVVLFELSDGQIQRSADYYDVAAILAQLGLLPMEEGTPEATPTG